MQADAAAVPAGVGEAVRFTFNVNPGARAEVLWLGRLSCADVWGAGYA